jgi:hypothetical protein
MPNLLLLPKKEKSTKSSEPRRSYKCMVCGKIGFWNKDWSYYGSYAHLDTCPKDLIFVCSEKCAEVATKKIHKNLWVLPRIGKHGEILKERKGY